MDSHVAQLLLWWCLEAVIFTKLCRLWLFLGFFSRWFFVHESVVGIF